MNVCIQCIVLDRHHITYDICLREINKLAFFLNYAFVRAKSLKCYFIFQIKYNHF